MMKIQNLNIRILSFYLKQKIFHCRPNQNQTIILLRLLVNGNRNILQVLR